MAEIAVDVVLLPSEEMAEMTIATNKELLKGNPVKIVLDKESCLPHISLAMGCIDESKIDAIENILKTIAKQTALEQLTAVGVDIQTTEDGEKISSFKIEKTEALQSLHAEVMLQTSPYFSYEVKAEMLVCPPEVNKSTLDWIKNYPSNSSYEKFSPHITIGYGEINNLSFPVRFAVSQSAPSSSNWVDSR